MSGLFCMSAAHLSHFPLFLLDLAGWTCQQRPLASGHLILGVCECRKEGSGGILMDNPTSGPPVDGQFAS